MGFIIGLLTVVLAIDCIFLILLILIQLPKKEAGMGTAFGGAATDASLNVPCGVAVDAAGNLYIGDSSMSARVRKVDTNGMIKCSGQLVFITTALSGWEVGLRVVGPDHLDVWFNYLFVGSINLQTYRFGSAPSRSAKAVSLAA